MNFESKTNQIIKKNENTKIKQSEESNSNTLSTFGNSFKSFINLRDLPDNLRISTITITCIIPLSFIVENIGKYLDLNEKDILSVKSADKVHRVNHMRTILTKSKKHKRHKKKNKGKKVFYNQVSIEVKISSKEKPINIKLFRNGSIQMTGCRELSDCIAALNILCRKLTQSKGIVDFKEKKIKPIDYVSNKKNMCIDKITNVSIRMINSNFNIGFKVDRPKLYNILLNKNIECSYEPCVHACVNIKYNFENTDFISIFVFESGAIIITGAKSRDHIVASYEFITKILFDNYNKIFKNDMEKLLKNPDILKMLTNIQQ